MSIYHWKLGDIALARVCKKVYAKVKVVKNEEGLFYDFKVLGISVNDDGSINATKELCYYVEIARSNQKLWLPYTSLHLAERGRPFYGATDKVSSPTKEKAEKLQQVPKKRKVKEEHILPLSVKQSSHSKPDLNVTYDIRNKPSKQGKYENAFKEFVRRGKEMIFDELYLNLQKTNDGNIDLYYLENVNASTEDKFEMIIKNFVTEKEIQNYLHQCWRYNFVHKQKDNNVNINNSFEGNDTTNLSAKENTPIIIHTTWCIVCGKEDRLKMCPNCPSCFHPVCRKEWLITIIHRKSPPKKAAKPTTFVEKILSSTRTICTVRRDKENLELCPSCMWGPRIGYDDVVWHKLGTCSWWPARVLTPGETPSCLIGRRHTPHQWPLRYYGTLNYSWGYTSRMCLFLPSHTGVLDAPRDPILKQAVLDACDDYISVYLT